MLNKSEVTNMEDTIDDYLRRGFGSMNKNDFEVWIFHWLITNHSECIDKSDFAISQYLRIPQSKVKRLRYEAGLKYQLDEEYYRSRLLDALKNGKCQGSEKQSSIVFSIREKIVREYLSNILSEDERFLDSSFNSDIVKLSADDFMYIIDNLVLTEKEKDFIVNTAKKNISSSQKGLPISWSELFKEISVNIGKAVLERVVGKGAEKIVDVISDVVKQKAIKS